MKRKSFSLLPGPWTLMFMIAGFMLYQLLSWIGSFF